MKEILEAIYGISCNEEKSTTEIKNFIIENFLYANYIHNNEIPLFDEILDDIIKELKQKKMLILEYYMDGEFYMIASNEFAETLNYDMGA